MAFNIFRLVGDVFIDTKSAEESLHKTDKQAQGVGKTFGKVGKGLLKAGGLAAGAVTAIGGAMLATVESTRDYRVEQAKLTTAFETSGHSAEDARSTYEELQGILGESDQAVEAANHLAQLTDNQEQLSEWTRICTGVYATFGDSLPIENLTEAGNETAKTGQITGGLADALNWAGVNEEDFQAKLDACSSEQERAQLITDTLNGLYGETADKYRENASETIEANRAQDRLNSTMARAGKKFEPAITAFKDFISDGLEKAGPMIEWLADDAIPALIEALDWLGDVAADVFDFIQNHYEDAVDQVTSDPLNLPGVALQGGMPYLPPHAAKGGVLRRGEVALLEGDGAEAIVPLENNERWIRAVARDMGRATGLSADPETRGLLADIRDLLAAQQGQQVVLDTGTVVGQLAQPMDRALGRIRERERRG